MEVTFGQFRFCVEKEGSYRLEVPISSGLSAVDPDFSSSDEETSSPRFINTMASEKLAKIFSDMSFESSADSDISSDSDNTNSFNFIDRSVVIGKGQKAKEVEDTGFKLWYTGTTSNKNGVGILVNKSLRDGVVDVKRQGDRMILVKLVVGDLVLNVISAYAPQVGHNESTKREFWEGLEDLVRRVPIGEKLFIGGDLNGHVGTSNTGFERVHGGFGYGIRNQEGEDVLSFALAYDMVVANTLFRKRESHLVTFSSGLHSSQIDFVLSRREDRRACIDCKAIPGESVVPQHKLVVADFRFRIRVQRGKRAKVARTKWWKLKGEASQAFRERVIKEGPWEEGGDANMMWTSMATCLRKVAVEEFGVTKESDGVRCIQNKKFPTAKTNKSKIYKIKATRWR
ncbi:hypothetical protein QYE76_028476 [Lolium multiflorum]|uniref:Craniofacial development protein 2-like n=1 Tax=Lolium multiflorum TaxID=4521 RepID=A0AAD8VH76_LOLMU|nr:hypothetical protein QYE76_028476 [Lolium multiflorum]